MKRLAAIALLVPTIALAAVMSPVEKALGSLEANYARRTAAFSMRLLYNNGDEQRSAELEFFASGADRSLITVKNQGGRFLRLSEKLLIYSPAANRPVKLSGRVFERSFLGSAFSFADLMLTPSFSGSYTGQAATSETIGIVVPQGTGEAVEERDCLVVQLASRMGPLAYRREIWIDREINMVVREKTYSLSGRHLKTIEYGDFRKAKKRLYPAYLRAEDPGRGAVSQLFVDVAEFDKTLPAGIFNP